VLAYARLLGSLIGGHAGLYRDHAKARAIHVALIVAFALTAFVFALVLATLALADWLGTMPALAIMGGLALLGCLVVLLLLKAEQRRHEAATARQLAEERRVAQAALAAAVPTVRAGGLLKLAIGVLAFVLAANRERDARRDPPPPPRSGPPGPAS
jgi:ABC-type dipeptide/oligopeptide/nickel transport system permease component